MVENVFARVFVDIDMHYVDKIEIKIIAESRWEMWLNKGQKWANVEKIENGEKDTIELYQVTH